MPRRPAGETPGAPAPINPIVEARLAHLERELRDLRTRINTLFYSVITVGLFDLLGGLFLR